MNGFLSPSTDVCGVVIELFVDSLKGLIKDYSVGLASVLRHSFGPVVAVTDLDRGTAEGNGEEECEEQDQASER